MNPEILFEDNHLLVAVKPKNVPVMSDESGDMDFQQSLKQWLKEKYNKPGEAWLGIVHRLDRPVGGVMVFAKTSKAAARLSAQFRERSVQKQYLAVVRGVPEKLNGKLRDFLVKDELTRRVFITKADEPRALEALLSYRVEESREDMSLLSITLETGRPHQIRVQLANMGHPVVGDAKYGNINEAKIGIALWCLAMEVEHPTKGERLRFSCSPPEIWPWSLFRTAI